MTEARTRKALRVGRWLLLIVSLCAPVPALPATIVLRAFDGPVTVGTPFAYTADTIVMGSQVILPVPDRIEVSSTATWPNGGSAAYALSFDDVSVDPAAVDGQILAIGYRVSQDRPSTSFSHPFRVALEQDGRFYQSAAPELRDNTQGSYTTWEDLAGAPAASWHEVGPIVFGDPTSNPDLSSAGSPIGLSLVLRHGASSGSSQSFASAFPIGVGPPAGFEMIFGVRPPLDFVPIDDPGNPCDTLRGCRGSVDASFDIGRFEVTVDEYVEFLNAVAADDPNGLYSAAMTTAGLLDRSGEAGSYVYSASAANRDLPIVYVSFWDAARYANWLHNGMPSGPQSGATTEAGAYTLTPQRIANNSVTRSPGARYVIPNRDEWFKAAYYDADSASYWAFPTDPLVAPDSAARSLVANFATLESESVPSPIGSHFASASPNGTYDQSGNVAEWAEDALGGGREFYGDNFGGVSPLFPYPPANEIFQLGFRVARRTPPVPGSGWAGLAAAYGLIGATGWRAMRRGLRSD